MIYREKTVILKNGTEALIKSPAEGDGKQLLELMKKTSLETRNMLREPEEFTFTIEEEISIIKKNRESPKSIWIAAFVDGRMAANAGITQVDALQRVCHRGIFGICVAEKYWGLGIGNELLKACIEMAKEMGFTQIELEVVKSNFKAQQLYKKFGFLTTGEIPNAFHYKDGTYENCFIMNLQTHCYKP